MAKSKSRNSRSSKTAHVLNLLTDTSSARENEKPENEESTEILEQNATETVAAAPPMESPSIPSAAPVHRAVDQEIELQIRSALEEALLEDISESSVSKPQSVAEPEPGLQPEPQDVAEPEPGPQPEPQDVAEPEPGPQPEPQDVAEPEPGSQTEPQDVAEPEPEPQTDPQNIPELEPQDEPEDQNKEDEFLCLNVMQTIVEDKAQKYIKMFGLCDCPRCRIDVVALTLTNLPAKYVVVTEQDRIPMLSVYEGHYSAEIISQVMNACKRVMEHPRHSKPKTEE